MIFWCKLLLTHIFSCEEVYVGECHVLKNSDRMFNSACIRKRAYDNINNLRDNIKIRHLKPSFIAVILIKSWRWWNKLEQQLSFILQKYKYLGAGKTLRVTGRVVSFLDLIYDQSIRKIVCFSNRILWFKHLMCLTIIEYCHNQLEISAK